MNLTPSVNLTLSLTDYLAMGPLLALFVTALLLILLETCLKDGKRIFSVVTIVGLAVALYSSATFPESHNPLLTPWLKFDSVARFFACLFLSIGLLTTLISSAFFTRFGASRAEYFFFLLSSLFGLILISSANDFLTLFLGLETLSIALYVLCGYIKKWNISHEAAFKYFLLGSISTAFLLFGIAMIYGATGSTNFEAIGNPANHVLFMSGIAMIMVSLLFKAAIVPFHIWAPDVYQGAPTPVTAFMAVGTKAGAFAALIRLFLLTFKDVDPLWHQAIAFLAYPTLIYANFVAIQQRELRRFFAYSGISHAGFLLIPLAAGGPEAASSMLFYLVIYTLATLGSFAVLAFIDDKMEGVTIRDLKGLFYRSPFLASIFTLCLLTLGGIPPTVGFFAKFYILRVGFAAGYYGLVVVGLLTAILSAYYYLRIAAAMFGQTEAQETKAISSVPTLIAATFSFSAIIALSFYSEPLLALLKQ